MVKHKKTLETAQWIVAFGHRLERARGRMGLTQAELAAADLSKSFVSLLETARSYPSVETLLLLARRAGTSVSALLMEPDELRLDVALSMIALARDTVWTRPEWAEGVARAAAEIFPELPLWAKGEATVVRGIAATLQNRLAEAERLAHEAQKLAADAGFVPGQAHALSLQGDISLLRREFPRSFEILSRAVALYRESGALRSEPGIKALIWQGTAALKVGRARYARRVYTRARALAARLRLNILEGQALWGLGHLAQTEGDLTEAARFLREARHSFEQAEDLVNLSEVLMNLAGLHREQGKVEHALAAVRQSIRIIERLGNTRRRSDAHQDLAAVLLQMGNLTEAEQAARQALDDANKIKDTMHRAKSLALLGRIAVARKDRSEAVRYLRAAARQFKALGMRDVWSEVSRDLGLLLKGETPQVEAAQYLTQALNPDALLGGTGSTMTSGPTAKRASAARRTR